MIKIGNLNNKTHYLITLRITDENQCPLGNVKFDVYTDDADEAFEMIKNYIQSECYFSIIHEK